MSEKTNKNTVNKNTYNNCLSINKIRLSVCLGWEKEERKTVQPVEVDIRLYYPALTNASLKDSNDFTCYDKMSRRIETLCGKKEFRLIEFLGMEIYRTLRPTMDKNIKIWVKVTKCRLPVEFVLGGASFSYTDLPPFSWVVPQ